jgi:hypothetical protein
MSTAVFTLGLVACDLKFPDAELRIVVTQLLARSADAARGPAAQGGKFSRHPSQRHNGRSSTETMLFLLDIKANKW